MNGDWGREEREAGREAVPRYAKAPPSSSSHRDSQLQGEVTSDMAVQQSRGVLAEDNWGQVFHCGLKVLVRKLSRIVKNCRESFTQNTDPWVHDAMGLP